ncbi:C13 family peptidase [Methylobacter sp.]|uniref:C13 family peptidase n=1 Tax=Methylobacter sp. TaxID=2051955 RepID=UPI0012051589|nr:C13 family peptidase [Methylobacter sp.]TAK61447.1 MAG: hypothetical protein EPO18_14105 [Methylobacter sp.]
MIQLACTQSADDFLKYQEFIQKQSKINRSARVLLWLLIGFYFTGLSRWFYFSSNFESLDAAHFGLLILSGALFLLSPLMAGVFLKRGGAKKWYEKASGEYRWELNAAGISVSVGKKYGFYPWSSVLALTQTEDTWYLFIKRSVAICIPKRAIRTEDEQEFALFTKKCFVHPSPSIRQKITRRLMTRRNVGKPASLLYKQRTAKTPAISLPGAKNLRSVLLRFKDFQLEHFVEEVNRYWACHPDNHGLALQSDVLQGIKQKSFCRDLYANLLSGIKLAFFYKVQALDFKVRISQIIGLVLVDVIVIASYDLSYYFPNEMLDVYGISDYAAGFVLFLLTIVTIGHLTASSGWQRLMVMLLSSVVVVTALYFIVLAFLYQQPWYTDDSKFAWILWSIKVAWGLLVVGRCLWLLYGLPSHSLIYLMAVYVFLVLVTPGWLSQQTFFTEDYRKQSQSGEEQKIDQEAIYYQQPELVSKMLSQLKPGRKDIVDLYFIGFAGSAKQKVFANEVLYAQHFFDKTYDTLGRSAVLINYKDTVNTTPLANAHNLASAAGGVSKLMDVDEDVLFLYLSSHGSDTFEISTAFYPFKMNNVAASKVKEILDTAGIKNRIIVVSACYSGGFIDVLKDDNTLILTAARKDRRSFGCSNEEQYTYFGDAYFVQALKNERSFVKAFSTAQKIIADREKTEQADSPASLPQLFVGKAIQAKLTMLER